MRILFYRDNNKPPAIPGEPVSFSFKENTSYDKISNFINSESRIAYIL